MSLWKTRRGVYAFDEIQNHGISPNIDTYFTLINSLWKNRKFKEASILLKKMEGLGMVRDIVLSTGIIDRMCKVGKVTAARQLFNDFSNRGLQPNRQHIISSFIMRQNALSYLVRMADAGFLQWFNKFHSAHFMHRTVFDDASKKLLKRSIVPWHLVKQYRFLLGFEEYHLLQPNASKGLSLKKEMEGDSCMLSKKPNTRSCGVDDNSKVNSVVKLGSTMSEDSIDVLPQDGAEIIKISKSMQFADMDVGMVENIRMSDSKYEGMFGMLAHSDDRDSSLVNYDTDTSEAHPPIEFIVHNVGRKSPSVIDDTKSPTKDGVKSVEQHVSKKVVILLLALSSADKHLLSSLFGVSLAFKSDVAILFVFVALLIYGVLDVLVIEMANWENLHEPTNIRSTGRAAVEPLPPKGDKGFKNTRWVISEISRTWRSCFQAKYVHPHGFIINFHIKGYYVLTSLLNLDKVLWKSNAGKLGGFSVKNVWTDLSEVRPKVPWYKMVWFSQNIPCHAFISWLAIIKK
ncbi:tetratricopeptide-like helical domain-containing protein [Tanacetum coccineum]